MKPSCEAGSNRVGKDFKQLYEEKSKELILFFSFNSTGGGESLPNGGDGVSPFNSVRSRSTTSRRHCEYCSTVRGTKQT